MGNLIKKLYLASVLSLFALTMGSYPASAQGEFNAAAKKVMEMNRVNRRFFFQAPLMCVGLEHTIGKRDEQMFNETFPNGVMDESRIPESVQEAKGLILTGKINTLNVRKNALARLAIERAASLRLLTTTIVNETNGVIKVHKFEQDLSTQQKYAVVDLMRNKAGFNFFNSLYVTLQQDLISESLGKFIELPAVTAAEVQHLRVSYTTKSFKVPFNQCQPLKLLR